MPENQNNSENENGIALEHGENQEDIVIHEQSPENLKSELSKHVESAPLPMASKKQIDEALGMFDEWDPTKSPAPTPKQAKSWKEALSGKTPWKKPEPKSRSEQETGEYENVGPSGSSEQTQVMSPEEIQEAMGEAVPNTVNFSKKEQKILSELGSRFPLLKSVLKQAGLESMIWERVRDAARGITDKTTGKPVDPNFEITPATKNFLLTAEKITQDIWPEKQQSIDWILNNSVDQLAKYHEADQYQGYVDKLKELIRKKYLETDEEQADIIEPEQVIREKDGSYAERFINSPAYSQKFVPFFRDVMHLIDEQDIAKGTIKTMTKKPLTEIETDSEKISIFEGVKRQVGAGGMGTIHSGFYAVIEKKDGTTEIMPLIQKLLKDPKLIESFNHERNILNHIEKQIQAHPEIRKHFARITLQEEGQIIMENLGSRNFGSVLDEISKLPGGREKEQMQKKALKVLADAMKANAWLHAQGIIHRDIKPENIMITEDESGEWNGVLIDFGISEHKSDDALQSIKLREGAIVGTMGYFDAEIHFEYDEDGVFQRQKSTEQKIEASLDEQTDLFAFASMLFDQRIGISINQLREVIIARGKIEILKKQGEIAKQLPRDLDTDEKILRFVNSREFKDNYSSKVSADYLIFFLNFEKYRQELIEFSKGEPDPRLREMFIAIFSRRGENVTLSDGSKPTMKMLEEITRSLI